MACARPCSNAAAKAARDSDSGASGSEVARGDEPERHARRQQVRCQLHSIGRAADRNRAGTVGATDTANGAEKIATDGEQSSWWASVELRAA